MKAWEKNIRTIKHPYVAGYQPKDYSVTKLNANENPYPPAPGVVKAMEEFETSSLRLYPALNADELIDEIAHFKQVKPSQVFVGVGSDDVIGMCFLTYFNSGKPILFPDITYSFYDVWADLYRIPYECPKLDEKFHIKKEDYYKDNGGIIFANPNAPTSIAVGLDFIRDVLEHNQDVIVIVDEAYIDFGGESAVSLLEEYDNLVVVQTFSKSRSLAGLRVGYCIASEELIQALNTVKFSYNSYTMNMLAIKLGAESVKDTEYFYQTIDKIIATRTWSKEQLEQLGFTCMDSSTNFLFATHKSMAAKEIFEKLQERKIYVRHFDKERIDNYLRITIGTDQQMEQLVNALKEILPDEKNING
ncbi:histidinol-phosphate transaminase [[Clostridium] polysaccharolyticum]|uniref:Histidinol-phosphate aminotransferase n=1 Tax=[Clostridium] polysaccharolyticum TaxID=29364 RepID=A0A1H9YLB3_9FIRM|nr:histidinol-phosphate transaminase [[Clostridium] polysaccharolyticum]SES69846.1 histidinol-phosphate aminotransferase [[Clostridium] polysaccharolyticum]